MIHDRRQIAARVTRLLREQKIESPPVPVDRILRALGARVAMRSLDDDVSGFIHKSDGEIIVGINSFHPQVRQRFTMAHELGHFLLHDLTGLHVDESDFAMEVKYRQKRSNGRVEREEREANLFAAELLMPRKFLESEIEKVSKISLHDDATIRKLAKVFGVSLQAILIRLTSIGLVDSKVLG